MKYYNKGKAKYISAPAVMLLLVLLTVLLTGKLSAQQKIYKALTSDSVSQRLQPASTDTSKPFTGIDSLKRKNFLSGTRGEDSGFVVTSDTFDIKMSKDSLDAPVVYHADDSMVMEVPEKKITLYGKGSNTKYEDNDLKAPVIVFDQRNNTVFANFTKDSTGKVIAAPTFKQGDMITVSDSITFNLKSKKGLTKGTYTQQGEMYVYGERIKKIDSTSFYAYRSRFTTCNLDTPHFSFVSKKIKFINKKFAVTGPVHPEFEGVPLPIYLPFGLFPMYQGRHSGFMAPQFTTSSQFGVGLERIGYYKVINDYWDVTLFGTIYSYGGWNMNISPRYYKRYRYSGNFSIDLQRTKYNFKGDPDYSVINTFNIRWQHSADTKSRPGVTFGASVNAGSSKYNQNVQTNIVRNYQNIFGSTINFSKIWKNKPYNMALTANHSQNTNLSQISITLPSGNFNLNTVYPFRRKEVIGSYKWYENIGFALNTVASSQTVFYDDTANAAKDKRPIFTQITQNWKWGATHNVPISLSLPPLGPLQVSPGISYSERWFQQKTTLAWNDTEKKIDTTVRKAFYSQREMGFSLSASSRIFGMFGFGKNSKVQAIRHEVRPNISASYRPDMNGKYFKTVQRDTAGNKVQYNVYQNNTSSPYGGGQFGGLSFSLDNNLQMKVRNKKDTSEGAVRKITLIDGFSVSGSYNFLADSFQFSPLSFSFRTNLFEKISITGSASTNLYNVDTNGTLVKRLIWKDKPFSLGRLTSVNFSVNSSINGGSRDGSKKNTTPVTQGKVLNPLTGAEQTDYDAEAAYIRNNPAEFTDFSIPWSVNYGLTVGISKAFNRATKRFKTTTSSNLTLSGTLGLTEKWQIGASTYYNISSKDLGLVTITIAREMHCWQMALSISPIGSSRYFTITISPKSGMLRDLKINRTRQFFEQP